MTIDPPLSSAWAIQTQGRAHRVRQALADPLKSMPTTRVMTA
jgi:hypothetical protein